MRCGLRNCMEYGGHSSDNARGMAILASIASGRIDGPKRHAPIRNHVELKMKRNVSAASPNKSYMDSSRKQEDGSMDLVYRG